MDLEQVVYVVDENLLRLGSGIVAVRRDTARFSRPPVHELLYTGILDPDWIPVVGFIPGDPIAEAFQFLGLDCLVRGDLAGAHAQLARAVASSDHLGFPQGPWSRGYVSFFEIWVCIEAGRLDDAAALATDMIERSERHGIEQWQKMGLVLRAAIETLVSLEAGNGDRTGSSVDITRHTKLLDVACEAAGIYHGFLESIRARRLISAGHHDEARRNLDAALQKADDNDEHFYRAELLRIRAHTHVDPDIRTAGFAAAAELARRQGATLFELRATLDDFELRGQPARAALVAAVSRMPTDGTMPEVALARAALDQADATRSRPASPRDGPRGVR